MKFNFFAAGIAFIGSSCVLGGLVMILNSQGKQEVAQSQIKPTNYRLMCWLPNGEAFYNGTALDVSANGSSLSFVPQLGPQTGSVVYTSNACTWQKL